MIRLLCIALASLALAAANVRADVYLFMLNRFGGIEVKTLGDELANVRFFQGNKQGEKTTFQAKLLVASCLFTYLTLDGVEFKIERLANPILHDANRRINSGEYRLRISGNGKAYDKIKAKLPQLADFASGNEDMTFYGERAESGP